MAVVLSLSSSGPSEKPGWGRWVCGTPGFLVLSQTMAGLVAGGLGVALMIAPVGAPHSAGVVYKPLEGDTPTWEMALAWRHDNETAVVRAFLAVSRDVVHQLQEGQDRPAEA